MEDVYIYIYIYIYIYLATSVADKNLANVRLDVGANQGDNDP